MLGVPEPVYPTRFSGIAHPIPFLSKMANITEGHMS